MNTRKFVRRTAAVGVLATGVALISIQGPTALGGEAGPPTTSVCDAVKTQDFTYLQVIERLIGANGVTTDTAEPRIDIEVNTMLDKEAKTILLAIYDAATQEDHQILVDYEDQTCALAPELKPVVEHVLEEDRIVQAQQCVAMREFIATGATADARGRTLNRAAADKYLLEWC